MLIECQRIAQPAQMACYNFPYTIKLSNNTLSLKWRNKKGVDSYTMSVFFWVVCAIFSDMPVSRHYMGV